MGNANGRELKRMDANGYSLMEKVSLLFDKSVVKIYQQSISFGSSICLFSISMLWLTIDSCRFVSIRAHSRWVNLIYDTTSPAPTS
jgi:hypothetical protein